MKVRKPLTKIALVIGITLTALVTPLQAIAAPRVQHVQINTDAAFGEWTTSSPTSETFIGLAVASSSTSGIELHLLKVVSNYDANGTFTGGSSLEVFGGGDRADVTFTLDTRGLSTAHVSGVDLLASLCSTDADHNDTCTNTIVDVEADWIGIGSISRERSVSIFRADGVVTTDHFQRISRAATVVATIDGVAISGEQVSADLRSSVHDQTIVCQKNC